MHNRSRMAVFAERLQRQLAATGHCLVCAVRVWHTSPGCITVEVLCHLHSVNMYDNSGILQVSGLKFAFDPSQPPSQRIVPNSIWVGDEEACRRIQPSARYRVALKAYMAEVALSHQEVLLLVQVSENMARRPAPRTYCTFSMSTPKPSYR